MGPVFTWADVGEEMRGGWGFGALGICTVEDLFVAPIFYVFALMHQRRPPVYFPLSLTTRSTQNSRLTKLRSLTNLTSIECQMPSHRARCVLPFILFHSRYSGQSVEYKSTIFFLENYGTGVLFLVYISS